MPARNRDTYKRLFRDKGKLNELIELLKGPAHYTDIARHFECDHSTIKHWAEKLRMRIYADPNRQKKVIKTPITFKPPTQEELNEIDDSKIGKRCVRAGCGRKLEMTRKRYWYYGNFCPLCTSEIRPQKGTSVAAILKTYLEPLALRKRDLLAKNIDRIEATERQKEIVKYRYGLLDNMSHTAQSTGEKFGVSRQRVSQIEKKIFSKLTSN